MWIFGKLLQKSKIITLTIYDDYFTFSQAQAVSRHCTFTLLYALMYYMPPSSDHVHRLGTT